MEPTDLNPKSSDDEQIDSWLRASSAVPPLPDDGFSARVLAALPPPIPRSESSLRLWLCAAGALLGVIVAASSAQNGPSASEQLTAFLTTARTSLTPPADSSTLLALFVTGASLVIVYWRELTVKLLRK